MSRQDLGRTLKLSEGRIGAFERGAAAISALDLWAVSSVLRCPVTAFFDPSDTGGGAPARIQTPIELLAARDDGADLAEAFLRLKTARLRRHLVSLARELVVQEAQLEGRAPHGSPASS